MPIRICRVPVSLVIGACVLLAACTPAAGVRSAGSAPANPETLLAEADAASERGDFVAAASAYRRAAENSNDESVAEQATRAAYDGFQLKEAARAADRWIAINPTSEEAHRYAGMAALRLHRLDKAEEEFSQLLDTAYISPAAGFLALLPVIGDEGIPTDVTELVRRLVARHPKVAEGHYALGNSALRSENFQLALSSAKQAAELAPYWTPAKMLLARTTIAAGQEQEGLTLAKDLVTAPDSDIATQLEYALLLAGTGHDEEARALLTPYATGRTIVPGAVRSLGAMDLDAGALDDAQKHFEDLLSTGSQSYESMYYLGVIAERRKDPDRALRYYTRVVGGDYAVPAQQRVARVKADQSGLAAGLDHLDQVRRTQPQLAPRVITAQAALASAFKDEKHALQVLNDGIASYPDLLSLRLDRVFLYERTNRADAAVRDLRALLVERPGDAAVQNALGYTLADHGRDLDEAQALLTSALAQSPDSAAILDSMGWLLHRRGKHAEALSYLKRSRELGNDPEIELHVGEVEWALGDSAAARKTWSEALKKYPEDVSLQERLKRAGP